MFNPDALLYRRAKGLQDYDERMAILLQMVQGQRFGRYFLPHAAGVAFSRNLYRWAPQIRRDDGFLRLVWGLGTRAVEREGSDYARLVAVSHPLLHPQASTKDTRHYSQQYVDLIDLEDNTLCSLPIQQVLHPRYPVLRYIAQLDQGDYLVPLRSLIMENQVPELVLTFDELFKRTNLASLFRRLLQILEKNYRSPVDTEFTLEIIDPEKLQPEVHLTLLQCRPQSHLKESEARLPQNLHREDIVFETRRMAPEGRVHNIRYVLFVTPEGYFALPTQSARAELVSAIGRLNAAMANETFICIGPGRWGTTNPDLGIHIGYGDIYYTRALVELTGMQIGCAPEASFGTHFFQDLVESNIYPLVIHLEDEGAIFERPFFYDSPNHLPDFLPDGAGLLGCLRVIRVSDSRPGQHLELVMDDQQGRSVAFFSPILPQARCPDEKIRSGCRQHRCR